MKTAWTEGALSLNFRAAPDLHSSRPGPSGYAWTRARLRCRPWKSNDIPVPRALPGPLLGDNAEGEFSENAPEAVNNCKGMLISRLRVRLRSLALQRFP